MEHLDLASVLATANNWNLPTFDQQDAIYLSNSRQMLEPILEETSEEDEEHSQSSWNPYENTIGFYSSAESETGSVIRIETNKEADSISERDFACPAKRPRRSQELTANTTIPTHSADDTVLLRRYQRNGSADNIYMEPSLQFESITRDMNQLSAPTQRNSTGSRRFEEFHSDSDSLSYNSLSRSSSLIQFESLERQLLLQEQHVSMNSLGASSPSLLSFEGSNSNKQLAGNEDGARSGGNSGNSSRRGSQISLLRRFESSDGRLHQTYGQLDKLNFDDELQNNCKMAFKCSLEADTCFLNDNESVKKDVTDSVEICKNNNRRSLAKNSAENLSEDSGYCEPSPSIMVQRAKTKHMPHKFEKFSEEEEEFNAFIEIADQFYDRQENVVNQTMWCCSETTEQINEDLCKSMVATENAMEPKINDATFIIDDDVVVAAAAAAATTDVENRESSIIKNSSPTLERQIYERSFSHSPSPASSSVGSDSSQSSNDRSVRSVSIDSAASFTWLPIEKEQQSAAISVIQESKSLRTNLRNSLPDIRDVYGQETQYFYQQVTQNAGRQHLGIHTKNTITKVTSIENTQYTEITAPDIACSKARHIQVNDSNDVEGATTRWGCTGSVNRYLFERATSMPNDLYKFGKTKKFNSNEKINVEEKECTERPRSNSWSHIQYPIAQQKSEQQQQQQQQEVPFDSETNQQLSGGVGYMNASYQNLTLLDYSGRQPIMNQQNLKRSTLAEQAVAQRESADYESIVCKGNFLLDELSQIYDRNASILNDRTVDSLLEESDDNEKLPMPAKKQAPIIPIRQKQHKTAMLGETDTENIVQHVQLTIRAPERQRKHKTNSLIVSEETPIIKEKTFDQDPTNLRTSYAQSLEKCNFDAKEISTTDVNSAQRNALPKRRFHSHAANAKKKNLVSSTPNLNAYAAHDQADMEDDMYVCSTYTSLNQLPQDGAGKAQKPLGILLPAGSRTSFGKEVSFCPIVSQYCWQEQSSEECNEAQLQRQDGQELADSENEDDNGITNDKQEVKENVTVVVEENDDKNNTVIYNTKENELIANNLRARPEILRANEQESMHSIIITTTTPITSRKTENQIETECAITPAVADVAVAVAVVPSSTGICQVSLKPSIVSEELDAEECQTFVQASAKDSANKNQIEIENVQEFHVEEIVETANDNNKQQQQNSRNTNVRPLSMQLPILSEPPINRAHHILYASQQLLDRRSTRELLDLEQTAGVGQQPHYTQLKATSVCNLQNMQQQQQVQQANNFKMSNKLNNNYNNKSSSSSKNLNKTDEKHPRSMGFLTRFANGLRFSLRRNKKKQQQQQQQQTDGALNITNGNSNSKNNNTMTSCISSSNSSSSSSSKTIKQKTPDFIYIPLKGPLPNKNINSNNNSSQIGAKLAAANGSNSSSNNNTKLVTGKPPLPKQPPRIIQNNNSKQNNNIVNNLSWQQSAGATHAQIMHGSGMQQQRHNMRFLEAERSYYDNNDDDMEEVQNAKREIDNEHSSSVDYTAFRNQLMAGMQSDENAAAAAAAVGNMEFTSPSRATVAQKTQLFQNLANKTATTTNGRLIGSVIVRPYNNQTHQSKTTTTINSENTAGSKIGLIETNLDTHETIISGKTRSMLDISADRNLVNASTTKKNRRTQLTSVTNDVNEHDLDVDVDDVGVVVIKTTANSPGGMAQIATVRRPHKSMEFLLDKENQKNVLTDLHDD